jgi:hypothetical protein
MSASWDESSSGALASPFAPTGEERRDGWRGAGELDELTEFGEVEERHEHGDWGGHVESFAPADMPAAGEEQLEDEDAIYAASLAESGHAATGAQSPMSEIPDLGTAAGEAAYGEDWLFPVGPIMPSPTIPAPAGPAGGTAQRSGTVTVAGTAVPIRVPPPCVAVPVLSTPERPCAGVDSTRFAGIAEVANFAGRIADCYANRMAQRRQRERRAKAQDEAERQARATKVPNETRVARAQRIAAARSAVQPEPVETVRTDIRARYRKFLEDEYRDTIIGARNRWAGKCRLDSVSRQWMHGVREQLDFVTLGTGGRGLVGFAPPPRPAGGDQLVNIEAPATTDGGAKVQPIMNAFLRELRARSPGHSAYNYPSHGGGAFNARGYSIDIELRGGKDERGFYPRQAAVQFLLAVDAAARAAGVEWRAIYNDYAVAAAISQHLDRKRVIFVGHPRRGGRRIGLNWHGPLILHFHVDITPRPAPGPSKE